jgi:ribonuclease BN (tRNA processing enzyme)
VAYTVSRDPALFAGKKYQIEQIGDINESIGDGRNRVSWYCFSPDVEIIRTRGDINNAQAENTEQGIYNLGDISADTNWINLLQGCDTVIHTAGRAHILNDDAQDALAEFRRVNHDATMKLARDAATSGVKHFIL